MKPLRERNIPTPALATRICERYRDKKDVRLNVSNK